MITPETLLIIFNAMKTSEENVKRHYEAKLDIEYRNQKDQWKQLCDVYHAIHVSQSLDELKKEFKYNPQGCVCSLCEIEGEAMA